MTSVETAKQMFHVEIERLIAQMKSCYASSRYKFKIKYKHSTKELKWR